MSHLVTRTPSLRRAAVARIVAVCGAAALCMATLSALYAITAPAGALLGQTLDEFAQRRAKLRQSVGDAVVLIVSPRADDDRLRYRPSNEMVYLTGVETPGAAVALLPAGNSLGSNTALFMPGSPDEAAEARRTGISCVRATADMWESIAEPLKRAASVYIVGPVGERGIHTASGAIEARIKTVNPKAEVRDIRRHLASLRCVKSAGELANIKSAIAATMRGFSVAAREIKPGATELAVEGFVLFGFRQAGAPREGFPAVVGSGPNSIVLHNDPTSRPLEKGETLIVDIGAEVNCYTADLTRTFPVGGRFTPRQLALYELVRSVQTACEKHVVAGKTTWGEINDFARRKFRESPLRAAAQDGTMHTMDRFFVHGLGHWLGLDVHDVGVSGPMPVGSVITIEPGLYIASESIGIRIEDDYLVTETGVEKLSAALPSDVQAIQRMMRGR